MGFFPIRHAYSDGMTPGWDWDFVRERRLST